MRRLSVVNVLVKICLNNIVDIKSSKSPTP